MNKISIYFTKNLQSQFFNYLIPILGSALCLLPHHYIHLNIKKFFTDPSRKQLNRMILVSFTSKERTRIYFWSQYVSLSSRMQMILDGDTVEETEGLLVPGPGRDSPDPFRVRFSTGNSYIRILCSRRCRRRRRRRRN